LHDAPGFLDPVVAGEAERIACEGVGEQPLGGVVDERS